MPRTTPLTLTSRLSLASPAPAADLCRRPPMVVISSHLVLLLCYTIVLLLDSSSLFVLLSLFVVVVPVPALARRAKRAAGTVKCL